MRWCGPRRPDTLVFGAGPARVVGGLCYPAGRGVIVVSFSTANVLLFVLVALALLGGTVASALALLASESCVDDRVT